MVYRTEFFDWLGETNCLDKYEAALDISEDYTTTQINRHDANQHLCKFNEDFIEHTLKSLVLAQKAYGVDWGKIEEGDYFAGNIEPVNADNRNKAKSLLLPDIRDYELLGSNKEITYLNVPVIRYKIFDSYIFNGKELNKQQIDKLLTEEVREIALQRILDNKTITHCYIYKGGYYRPGSSGYTDRRDRAGIFTKEKAVSSARSCGDLTIIPINLNEHNKMINGEINELKERLIHV